MSMSSIYRASKHLKQKSTVEKGEIDKITV